MNATASLLAGIPIDQPALFHRVRFAVGDPAGWLKIDLANGSTTTIFIVRDIEVARAKQQVEADLIVPPAKFAPSSGLSADRATATAQSIAEAMRQHDVRLVRVDRSLPFIFAHYLIEAGIQLEYQAEFGVLERRVKSDKEIEWLAEAQRVTETAMEMACNRVAQAKADRDGTLFDELGPMTSERIKAEIARFLIERNFGVHHGSIVATAPLAADCHESGSGELRTEQPVIIDIFPRDERTRYHGDCTRTVVHGQPTEEVLQMHHAVQQAKAASTAALRPGATGEQVHQAAIRSLQNAGFVLSRGELSDAPTIQHGTGHGIGLEIHEPILLDDGGPEIFANEVFTVEPGLYGRRTGGVRIEDMVVVGKNGPVNLNHLPEGLDWRV